MKRIIEWFKSLLLSFRYWRLRKAVVRRHNKRPHTERRYRILKSNVPSLKNVTFKGTPVINNLMYIRTPNKGTLTVHPSEMHEVEDLMTVIGRYNSHLIIKRID
jgi:hypothetical protein